MELHIWQGFRIETPDDWEMLRYGRRAASGRCLFADRHQFRLEFNWRRVEGRPDFERMMSDYFARLKEKDTVRNVRKAREGQWEGIEGEQEGLWTSRYGCFFPTESTLIEMVFIWPEAADGKAAEKPDRRLTRRLLSGVAPEPLARDDASPRPVMLRRWRAFGMDLQTPSDIELNDCTIEPANASLVFVDQRRQVEERFTRLGMARHWLKEGGLPRWLELRKPPKAKRLRQNTQEVANHCIVGLHGDVPSQGLLGWFGLWLRYDEEAWICPRDGRVYRARRVAPHVTGEPGKYPLFGIRLTCCGAGT